MVETRGFAVRRQSDGSAPLLGMRLAGPTSLILFSLHLGARARAGSLLQSRGRQLRPGRGELTRSHFDHE